MKVQLRKKMLPKKEKVKMKKTRLISRKLRPRLRTKMGDLKEG